MREVIRQKIIDSAALPMPVFTRRSIRVRGVPGKALAVVGPRRAGKTTFLWQIAADRVASGVARDGLLYFNFEDERVADMTVAQIELSTRPTTW